MIPYSLPNPPGGSMLEKLITARHGQALGNALTLEGITTVEQTARALQRLLKGHNTQRMTLLASPVERAQKTATITANILGLTGFETHNCLREDFDFRGAAALVTHHGQSNPVVIIVTHEPGEDFPRHYWKEALGESLTLPFLPLEKGQATILNTRSGRFEYVL